MSLYGLLITATAKTYDIDLPFFSAVVLHESSGDTWAHEFEAQFYRDHLETKKRGELIGFVPAGPPWLITEKVDRATSWGLLQVLGETARELGYAGKNLPQLCVPETGIAYGAKYLRHCIDLANGDLHQAALKFNGGGDANYPVAIQKIINDKTYEVLL